MATYQIWHMGTDEFSIEEAMSEKEACEKLGWESQECRVRRIPDQFIVRDSNGAKRRHLTKQLSA